MLPPSTSIPLLVWLATGFNICAGLLVLLRPWQRRTGTRSVRSVHVLTAACILLLLLMAEVIVMKPFGLKPFGVVYLLYLSGVVVAPALSLVLLLTGRWGRKESLRRVSRSARILAVFGLLPVVVGYDASFIEPYRTRIEHTDVRVPAERAGTDMIRIGVLADIQTTHVGDHEREAVRFLMAQQPHIIILPGDLWFGTRADFQKEASAVRDLLSPLHAPGGVYFIYGNLDNTRRTIQFFEGTQVQLLDNRIARINIGDRRITIGGLGRKVADATLAAVREMEEEPDTQDIRILVAHYPDMMNLMQQDSRVDLFLAAHTHGGQIQLPGVGPLFTSSLLPRHVAGGGLHTLSGRRVYISRGVGSAHRQAPTMRFLCPPEVSVLEIETGS